MSHFGESGGLAARDDQGDNQSNYIRLGESSRGGDASSRSRDVLDSRRAASRRPDQYSISLNAPPAPDASTRHLQRQVSLPSPPKSIHSLYFGVAFFCVLAAFLGVFAVIILSFQTSQKVFDYGMVIDAGSHGSRIHIFRWPPRLYDPSRPFSGPMTFPKEIAVLKVTPGISSYANDTNNAGKGLQPLIEFAMKKLAHEKHRWYQFPLYLKATAGMRDLEADLRGLVMENIRAHFQNPTYVPFLFQPGMARVIAGEEEGAYGWLTVNHARNTLFGKSSQTLGAIDMGGASAQVTFMPLHTSILEGFFPIHISSFPIFLYSHSFLGYGWGDSQARVSLNLAYAELQKIRGEGHARSNRGQDIWAAVDHPCFLKSYNTTYHFHKEELLDGRERGLQSREERLPKPRVELGREERSGVDLTERNVAAGPAKEEELAEAGGGNMTVVFHGSGNWNQCMELAKSLFYRQPCFTHTCSFNGVYQPRFADSKFVAFGEYATLAGFMGLKKEASLKEFGAAARQLCAFSPHELDRHNKRKGSPISETNIPHLCWKISWSFAMLHHGLGLPLESNIIEFADTVHSSPISWATGSMIYEINYFPWKVPYGQWELPFWVAVVVGCFFFTVAVALARQVAALRSKVGEPKAPYSFLNSLGGVAHEPRYHERRINEEMLDRSSPFLPPLPPPGFQH